MKYRLPKTFYDDHKARGLPSGREISRTSRHVYVDLSPGECAELLSDARHYSSEWRNMDRSMFGLGRSAVATIKALQAQREAEGGGHE